MDNQDKKLLDACTGENVSKLFRDAHCAHPLDNDITQKLRKLGDDIHADDDDYALFHYQEQIDELWGLLLQKAIVCLRYHDEREPFKGNGKKTPKAYGLDELKKYYKKYKKFENVLYGTSQYYRDHVVHVFRTWLCGIELLVRNKGSNLGKVGIMDTICTREKKGDPIEKKIVPISPAEKISIWTLIALTHDLGYPLEKARNVIGITQDMVSTFVRNPDISADFSFHGPQNYMNDFVVRLMSSKMEFREEPETEESNEKREPKPYVARLQPKYYFKFQKSLERNEHGILSTLIIYKLLTYFLESDYNINEDYRFSKEDCRQFYIRREILRAIASHTCNDVYQMYMGSFSFLLRICDDAQEWGRKNISELYVKSAQEYKLGDIDLQFNEKAVSECTISEDITVPDSDSVRKLLERFRAQAITYVTIFRDGQDTSSRDFSFNRKLTIKAEKIEIIVELHIERDSASKLDGTISYCGDGEINARYGKNILVDLPLSKDGEWKAYANKKCSGKLLNEADCAKWRSGSFGLDLSD